MDESGIRQFVLTVVDNMLSGVGRAGLLNCSQNAHPAYLESIKPDGTYWKVHQAAHDVGPKIVPLKSLSAKFLDAELFKIMKELFKEEYEKREWKDGNAVSYAYKDILG
jgi:hypothetical protein